MFKEGYDDDADFKANSAARNTWSEFMGQIPVVGNIMGGIGALTGCDYIAGRKLSNTERLWDAGTTAITMAAEIAPFLKLCKNGCFVAGTLVQTPDGPRVIEQLKQGDVVWSRDPKTGQMEAKEVLGVQKLEVGKLIKLTFADPKTGQPEDTVVCSENHPFAVNGKGFVDAVDLEVGSSIITRDGPSVKVASVEHLSGLTDVYNLDVADDHTFFVGSVGDGIWVHNATLCRVLFRFQNLLKKIDHFNRHGNDFGATDADFYEAQGSHFLNDNDPNALVKYRRNGNEVRFNPVTNEFAVGTPNGVLRTYYKPDPVAHGYPTNMDYYNAQ
jgi:hypothetical protein